MLLKKDQPKLLYHTNMAQRKRSRKPQLTKTKKKPSKKFSKTQIQIINHVSISYFKIWTIY